MKFTVARLRQLINDSLREGTISAHPSYMKKEAIRERLQDMVKAAIEAGDITGPEEFDRYIADVDMALKALKMVPFAAWESQTKPRS